MWQSHFYKTLFHTKSDKAIDLITDKKNQKVALRFCFHEGSLA